MRDSAYKSADELRSEFDESARLLASKPVRRSRSRRHQKQLAYLPAHSDQSLEVGCGLGDFARLMSRRSEHVTAIDLSPEMIRLARERSADFPNIEYVEADITTWQFPVNRFDCVVSFATLHHVPLEPVLHKLNHALRPGGTLLIIDLYEPDGWRARVQRFANFMRWRLKRVARRRRGAFRGGVWQHDPNERRPSIAEVRGAYQAAFPGIRLIERYPYRFYTAHWIKPHETQ